MRCTRQNISNDQYILVCTETYRHGGFLNWEYPQMIHFESFYINNVEVLLEYHFNRFKSWSFISVLIGFFMLSYPRWKPLWPCRWSFLFRDGSEFPGCMGGRAHLLGHRALVKRSGDWMAMMRKWYCPWGIGDTQGYLTFLTLPDRDSDSFEVLGSRFLYSVRRVFPRFNVFLPTSTMMSPDTLGPIPETKLFVLKENQNHSLFILVVTAILTRGSFVPGNRASHRLRKSRKSCKQGLVPVEECAT